MIMENYEKYDILTDFEILCSKLSKKTQNKLLRQLKRKKSSNKFQDILSILQINAEDFLEDKSSLSFHDGTCLVRAAIRFSVFVNDVNWITKIKSNDIFCIWTQIGLSTQLSLEEQWKIQEKLLNLFDYTADPEKETAEISKLLSLVGCYYNLGNFNATASLIERGTELYNRNPNDKLLTFNYVFLLIGYSWNLRENGKIKEAKRYLLITINLIKQLKSQFLKMMYFNTIGGYYDHLGKTKEALEAVNISKKIREEWGDKRGIYVSLTNIGTTLMYQGKYDAAFKALERAYHLGLQLLKNQRINQLNFSVTLSNLAEVVLYKDDLNQAYDLIKKADSYLNPISRF